MDMSKKYIEVWKENCFQKNKRIDFSFWHGKKGIMNTMIEREKAGDPE